MKKVVVMAFLGVFFALLCTSCLDLDFETEITELNLELKDHLVSDYDIHLPDSVEFLQGKYVGGIDPDVRLYFKVKKAEFEPIMGENWEKGSDTSHNFGDIYYKEYMGKRFAPYYQNTSVEYTYLFYSTTDDMVECVFVGFEKYIN